MSLLVNWEYIKQSALDSLRDSIKRSLESALDREDWHEICALDFVLEVVLGEPYMENGSYNSKNNGWLSNDNNIN